MENPSMLSAEPLKAQQSLPVGNSCAHLNDDGRIDINWDSKWMRGVPLLYSGLFLRHSTTPPPEYSELETNEDEVTVAELDHAPEIEETIKDESSCMVKLNIVIQIVGSRGDVQPFIALGTELMRHGHRVRLATHDLFENFVEDSGLEFYPIGGDPAELMSYMVKSPGLIPSMKSLRAGEIRRRRIMIREMLDGCWRSCIEADLKTGDPFVADAIIANPPSFAHIHCAQALGIPVHLMFTMPWSNTRAFPHPLANMMANDTEKSFKNHASYDIVNWLVWQGVGDVINEWRRRLDLDEVAMFEGPHLAEILKVPVTYCWSPALVPRPSDWLSHIDVCGFFFRDAPGYKPPNDLQGFLSSGSPPVYIGFGSIVHGDSIGIIKTILGAVKAAGVRAIISKGWSNLNGDCDENIYFIGDCPHEWLFKNVAAVVHHGGAGTTACGLLNGKPTIVVPFFGDQPFWGAMIAAAGAGPPPIPHTELTVEKLTEGIRYCLTDQAMTAASVLAMKMHSETGAKAAVSSFHRQLPMKSLSCDIFPTQPAVWSFSKDHRKFKFSKLAAAQLIAQNIVEPKQLKTHVSKRIVIENRRWDPLTGGASAVMATTTDLTGSIVGIVSKPFEEYQDYRMTRKMGQPSSDSAPVAKERMSPRSYEGGTTQTEESGPSTDLNPRPITSESSSISSRSLSGRETNLAGRMAGASLKSLGNFVPTALKGMTVDIPLAMTEGLRNFPRYYGEEPRDHGSVDNIKSGFTVGGKAFAWGMTDALGDLALKPYQGARKDGAKGAVKGMGKGMANMVSKAGHAMFGVVIYPSAGIAKSLKSAVYSGTKKSIVLARHGEGIWLMKTGEVGKLDNNVLESLLNK